MEEVSVKIQNEIDQYLLKLEDLLKNASMVDPIYEVNKEVSDLILNEIALQAKFNTEVWKLEKICKIEDDESSKIGEIITWVSFVIRETQKRTQEIEEMTKKMREDQQQWRKEKEIEFEKSTSDLASKINSTAASDESDDENLKL